MSETIYQKYRPKAFSDVRGQDEVIKVLEASIKKNNIGHAYLFAGSRGTGKTSVARIFASEIGCTPTDLYEIDAASNRGVDEVRTIKEAVNSMPYESPVKVYVLDEAHMLTKEAWNALLKTLEEPPKHVMFILATTDIEKIPETILSRCQTFTFKKPSQKLLKETIEEIVKNEGFSIEKNASDTIALLGDGSFRDSQSILQKVISSTEGKSITLSHVENVTGAPKSQLLQTVIEAVDVGKIEGALESIKEASDQNIDMKVFIKLLLERMRAIMLLRFSKDMEKDIENDFSPDDFESLKKIAVNKKSNINSKSLSEVLRAYEEVGTASIKELPLELALMRIVGE